MAGASGVIQNLINGVSQQPAAVRLPTQVEAQVNAHSTVTAGLRKRPPARHLAMFSGFPTTLARYHVINRDADERYGVAFADKAIYVRDLAGNAKTVNLETVSFLSADIGETTYISLNAVAAAPPVNGGARKVTLPTGLTTLKVVTSGMSGVDTVLVQESTTGLFAGEETTAATISADATTNVTVTSGRYYRCRLTADGAPASTITATMRWAISNGTYAAPHKVVLKSGDTTLNVVTAGTFVGTLVVQESTTGLFAGEETTAATITTATTTAVTATSGRYYRVKSTGMTSGSVTATMQWHDASYLVSTDPKSDFRAITVADFTFFLNRSITIASDAYTKSAARNPEALIHVPAGNYAKKYKILVNGAVVSEYLNISASSASSGSFGALFVMPDNIAKAIGWGASSPNGFQNETYDTGVTDADQGDAHVISYLANTLTPEKGWRITRYGNVLHLENLNGDDFTIATEGDDIRVHKDTETTFANLPTQGPDGFVIKIAGDATTDGDDYYVKFVAASALSGEKRGAWVECVAKNTPTDLDAFTMPHALVREANGTFTFRQLDYDGRGCGDTDSVSWPSFVGGEAKALVFYRNRLGMIADENTILSRAGDFYNFFRQTMTTVLDTDPVDVAVSHPKVSTLTHAVPYNENLILFSALTQFRLSGDETLTPKTANIKQVAEYRADQNVTPVACGNSMFFLVNNEQSTSAREFIYDPTLGTKDGPSVTGHVDRYLPATPAWLAANPQVNMLAVGSEDDPERVYVYKFFVNNNEKLQSSWSYWDFTDDVLHGDFIDNSLIVFCSHADGVSVCSVPCEETYVDAAPDLTVHLDRRLDNLSALTPSYNAGTNRTSWTLPYPAAGVAVITDDGAKLPVVSTASNTVTVAGDYHAQAGYIGFEFESRIRLSEIVPKKQSANGETALPVGALVLHYLTLTVASTGYLRAEVGQTYRSTKTKEFDGALLGDAANLIGAPAFTWDKFRIPIMARAGEVAIDLVNDTYQPFSILNGEWQGNLYRRN